VGGLDANLSAGRIVEQVWRLRSVLPRNPSRPDELPRITNVVFMGMGEPLSNFRPVTTAIRTIVAPWGHAISARKITISTVGMPRAIERLAEEFDLPVTLALSLHAPTDDIRRTLIPWAEYSTIAQLLAACQKWFEKTGREVTLEYTLLAGVNDAPEHAAELARLARSLRANVNLIRYNEVAGMPFSRPATAGVRAFQDILRARGINGQLRHEAKVV
jgi:23S rRNA (adenine2503-C2)-methyltransferase